MFINGIRSSSSAAAIRTKSADVRRYLDRQLKDAYAKLAREHSFRARSAFKLMEMDEHFGILQPGFNVLDIGAAPGSWCQVAQLKVQPDGYILGIDLQSIQPLKGVEFLHRADITDPLVQQAVVKRLAGRKIDCILSDMAPNPTGSKEIDHIRIVELCRSVLKFINPDDSSDPSNRILLGDTARFVCKIWDGPLKNEISKEISKIFGKVRVYKPDCSRENSAELFLYSKRIK